MFTKRHIENLPVTGKTYTVKDEKTPGLILLVTPKGAKTFYSYRWLDGRPERIKLGTFPALTVEQARAAATKINGAVATGGNPAEVKRTVRAEPTFGEIFERFLQEKRNRSGKPLAITTATGYRKVVDTYLNGIKAAKLSSITPERARSLVSKIKSPAQLNHAKAILSSVFNWANDEGIIDQPNPARRLKTKAIPSRERFLLPSELPRFMAAVEASPLRDFFLLALFTGARRSNLQAMRWRDVNLEEATWTIPKTKNGAPQTVTLPPEAVEIIRERRRQAVVNACYVFPGPGATGHLVEPKAAWRAILKAAELDNLRLHDLRRTLGSWQARAGASTIVIGKSLGHRSQQATAIYSRLDLDPVRASVEGAVSAMVEAGKQSGAKVVPIKRA